MKVAIIGSGISALSCAHELKKHGIIPTIFEKGLSIGGKLDIPLLTLRMYITPYRNPFKYLSKKYDINIKPYSSVNEISIVSQNQVLNVKGKLGHLMARPPYYDAIDYQIEKQVNLPVNFNSNIEIEELMKEYDYVIDASTDMGNSKKFSFLSQTFVAQVRIAHVLGNFRLDSVTIWCCFSCLRSVFISRFISVPFPKLV
jgi:digeranylgeranylglycerophospholipid reductase